MNPLGEPVLPSDLEQYLHEHIPLSKAMQVSVVSVAQEAVVLRAPLAPNINHRDTVFGGSASAVAILAAWSLLHTRLRCEGFASRLVIQRNAMDYDQPIPGDFTARSSLESPQQWHAFTRMLSRKGRARITALAHLECDGLAAGRFSGDFVALNVGGGA